MATKFNIGDAVTCVAGEKIYWCFGEYEPRKNDNRRGTFSLNGTAEVIRRKVATKAPLAKPQERELIRCKVAKYECVDFRPESSKTPCGAHTCYHGILIGAAKCTIQVPTQNIPSAGPGST